MQIDDKLVRHVAKLARLELTDEEFAHYGRQLQVILEYVDQLKEVDVEGIEPLAHAGDFVNVFRADEARPSLPKEDALRNAPEREGDFFVVPRVIEAGSTGSP